MALLETITPTNYAEKKNNQPANSELRDQSNPTNDLHSKSTHPCLIALGKLILAKVKANHISVSHSLENSHLKRI